MTIVVPVAIGQAAAAVSVMGLRDEGVNDTWRVTKEAAKTAAAFEWASSIVLATSSESMAYSEANNSVETYDIFAELIVPMELAFRNALVSAALGAGTGFVANTCFNRTEASSHQA